MTVAQACAIAGQRVKINPLRGYDHGHAVHFVANKNKTGSVRTTLTLRGVRATTVRVEEQ